MSPLEQFAELLGIFGSGEFLTYGYDLKPLTHAYDGIWELKTADLRIFGWFPHMDCFIAHKADLASRIKDHGLYHGYIGEVGRFRDNLELDDPKFISGVDPRVVVSNFNYP